MAAAEAVGEERQDSPSPRPAPRGPDGPGEGDSGRLSRDLERLLREAGDRPVTVGAILDTLSGRGQALALVFFAFPLCLPIGIPILTTMLGPVLAYLGWFVATGRPLWLPKRLRYHSVSPATLRVLSRKLVPCVAWVERRLRPRLVPLTGARAARVHGIYIMALALVASLPLPVLFANLVAALPVLLMGLALLRRDGLAVLAAYAAVAPCILLYGALVMLGREAIEYVPWF